MKSKIVIFEGNQEHGIFSIAPKFYPPLTTKEEAYDKVKKARLSLSKKYQFNHLHMFQVAQKKPDENTYPDNKFIIIGDEHMQKDDYFKEILPADILIINEKYKNIVLSHRMADCPILILEDRKNGFTGIAHCGITYINRCLPKGLVEAMIKNCHSKPENLYLYIGSCIKKESYIYDTYPKNATNENVWKNSIIKEVDGYHIDLIQAIKNQLQKYNLKEIKESPINTATTKGYASHYAYSHGDESKLGQNIVCFYYE